MKLRSIIYKQSNKMISSLSNSDINQLSVDQGILLESLDRNSVLKGLSEIKKNLIIRDQRNEKLVKDDSKNKLMIAHSTIQLQVMYN